MDTSNLCSYLNNSTSSLNWVFITVTLKHIRYENTENNIILLMVPEWWRKLQYLYQDGTIQRLSIVLTFTRNERIKSKWQRCYCSLLFAKLLPKLTQNQRMLLCWRDKASTVCVEKPVLKARGIFVQHPVHFPHGDFFLPSHCYCI